MTSQSLLMATAPRLLATSTPTFGARSHLVILLSQKLARLVTCQASMAISRSASSTLRKSRQNCLALSSTDAFSAMSTFTSLLSSASAASLAIALSTSTRATLQGLPVPTSFSAAALQATLLTLPFPPQALPRQYSLVLAPRRLSAWALLLLVSSLSSYKAARWQRFGEHYDNQPSMRLLEM